MAGLHGTGPDASLVLGPPRLVDACLRDGYASRRKVSLALASDENGQEFGFTGEVLEVTPHAKIVHTQIFDAGDLGVSMGSEPSIITVTFQETNGITNMTTTIRYASKADRDAAFATGMTDGMEVSYKQLDGVLAEG